MAATAPPSYLLLGEHSLVTLPPSRVGAELFVNGVRLPQRDLRNHMPFITDVQAGRVEVDTHDWVGCLRFTSADGALDHSVYVFPSKLAEDPDEAFSLLGRMVDQLPAEAATLGFPTELVPLMEGLQVQPPALGDVQQIAWKAWQLLHAWRQMPKWTQGRQRRVVRGGLVPDRVDWHQTLEHWGRGGFPEHVASDLPQTTSPPGGDALRELWQGIEELAGSLTGGEELAARARAVWSTLPPPGFSSAGPDRISLAARRLREQLQVLGRQTTQRPSGHASMPALYELWVQVGLLRALDATDGRFRRREDGLFEGTFRGPGVNVTLNPRFGFRGVGQGQQHLMPDILVVFDSGDALVADVKYRALHRLPTEQGRELNRQMLTYMGLSHAATGVVLWPALPGEPDREEPLPGGRARLLRLRCHPADSPGTFQQRLAALHFPGVS